MAAAPPTAAQPAAAPQVPSAAPGQVTLDIGDYSQEYKTEVFRIATNAWYDVPGFFEGKVQIVDIGAGVGPFPLFAHITKKQHWPEVVYVGYEPDAQLALRGQKNLAVFGKPDHYKLMPFAVVANKKADEPKTVLLKRRPDNPHKNTIVFNADASQTDVLRVPAIEAKTIINCDVLKISAPNTEFPLLREYLESRKTGEHPRYILYRYTSEQSRAYAILLTLKDYTLYEAVKESAGEGLLKFIAKSVQADVFRTLFDAEGYKPERDDLFERGLKGLVLPKFE